MLTPKLFSTVDIIAAISTAHGRGGIGIVRVSGKNLQLFVQTIVGKTLEPRLAVFTFFLDSDGNSIDQGIVIFFPSPNSYTGDDVLELQGHGGIAVLQLVLQRCLDLGARLAQPGEFTLRAYLNGKLDLLQAESIADLIDATTTQAAKSAVRSLQGDFSRLIYSLVEGLVQLRCLVESMLDFSEEEIETIHVFQQKEQLELLCKEVNSVLNLARQGSLLREGAFVVLIGRPNVGKSSLLNCLSGEDIALVSEIPGTTRDAIRQTINLNGVPLHIIDTAGLRESSDLVELLGIARTRDMIKKADAILLIYDQTTGINQEDKHILNELPSNIPKLNIFNKIDLENMPARVIKADGIINIYLSAKYRVGIDLLRHELSQLIGWHHDSGVFMARERHVRALKQTQTFLQNANANIAMPELMADDLRNAQQQLSLITGDFSSDDLLGQIFSRFCIGK